MAFSEIGVLVAFVLTLVVYSYLIADNFLYRAAVYIFVGLTAGFVAVVTWQSFLTGWLADLQDIQNVPEFITDAMPIIIVALLLIGQVPAVRVVTFPLRQIALAFLIGVGAAVATVGAVNGTLIPLTLQTGRSPSSGWLTGGITLVGVISVLTYFQYAARRRDDGTTEQNVAVRGLRTVGGYVLAITFGTLYAGAIATALAVFAERMGFLIERIFGG
jgi:hypothetical protein